MKLKCFLIAIIGVFTLFSQTVFALSVEEIVKKANHAAYYQGTDGKANVKMVISDSQGRERTRNFTILRKDIDDKNDTEQRFYVYFHRPADVNKTAFLVWKHPHQEDDRWLYLPALDLIKRIAASDERTNFVGSHFFYEDVSGRTPTEDNHQLLQETEHYFVVKSTPKNPNQVEFSYYKNWIHKTTFLPIKTEYYGPNNEIYRTYEALKVDTIDGFTTVTEAKMTDTHIGGSTHMTYSKVKYNIGLPEATFSERYLRAPPRKYLR